MSAATDLVVLEELKQLKYRYLRCVDTKDWDGLADTLTQDVAADYGDQRSFAGHEAVMGFFTGTLTAGLITTHNCHHPELAVDGSEATGRWALQDTVISGEYRVMLSGAGYYTDRYRREADGMWRIASTTMNRLYETTLSLDDLPSLKLTIGVTAGA